MIYLDNAATTPLFPEVLNELNENYRVHFYNPSSPSRESKRLLEEIQFIKVDMMKLLGINVSDKSNIFFTSGATESNNWIIRHYLLKAKSVLYFKGDHPSLVNSIESTDSTKKLFSFNPYSIDSIKYFDGLTEEIDLIALSSVNNQTGQILSEDIFRLLKEKFPNAFWVIDHVQGIGKVEISYLNEVDAIVFAAHKMGGPKGIGALFLKNTEHLTSFFKGGDQENGMRPGTLNYPLIKGLYSALKLSLKEKVDDELKRKACVEEFLKAFHGRSDLIEFPFKNHSPFILCGLLKKIPADVFMRHLEQKNIIISTTSACSSKIKAYNPSLEALGIGEKWHKHVFRISLFFNTDFENLKVLEKAINEVLLELKFLMK